jgi:hypothetical protein
MPKAVEPVRNEVSYVKIGDGRDGRPVYVMLAAAVGGRREPLGLRVGRPADRARRWASRLKGVLAACDATAGGSLPLPACLP